MTSAVLSIRPSSRPTAKPSRLSFRDIALSASTERRAAEHAKYVRAYASANYGMGDARRHSAVADLAALPRGSYLDVGCGRGEMIAEALRLGFIPCDGTEVV